MRKPKHLTFAIFSYSCHLKQTEVSRHCEQGNSKAWQSQMALLMTDKIRN